MDQLADRLIIRLTGIVEGFAIPAFQQVGEAFQMEFASVGNVGQQLEPGAGTCIMP